MVYDYIIGIDTGVNTGVAVWSTRDKRLIAVETLSIHRAIELVNMYSNKFVIVEDARKRSSANRLNAQGVGSVKRDAKVWEDYLIDYEIPHEMRAPKRGATKIDSKTFKLLTRWTSKTSNHARDAAMIVFDFKFPTKKVSKNSTNNQ